MRERYEALVADPAQIEAILRRGAEKARAIATPFMARLRDAVGLRSLAATPGAARKPKAAKAALPAFKQYREADGRHYFKLVDADGRLLAQSAGFASPQEAGRAVAQLKSGADGAALDALQLPDGVTKEEITAALGALSQG